MFSESRVGADAEAEIGEGHLASNLKVLALSLVKAFQQPDVFLQQLRVSFSVSREDGL